MWEEKLGEELQKTGPLEEVCAALREELDAAHKQRLEAFEIKMKPIIIRDGPSRKVSVKRTANYHFSLHLIKVQSCHLKNYSLNDGEKL